MIWDLLNFGLLMWLGRQKRFKLLEGDLLWVYLVVYSVGSFFIEAIRVDSALVSGIALPQIIAVLSIIIAVTMFILRHRPGSGAKLSETNLPPEMVLAMNAASTGRSGGGSRSYKVRKVSAGESGSGGKPEDVSAESAAGPPATATEPQTEGL